MHVMRRRKKEKEFLAALRTAVTISNAVVPAV
jgi:hypothetical protein